MSSGGAIRPVHEIDEDKAYKQKQLPTEEWGNRLVANNNHTRKRGNSFRRIAQSRMARNSAWKTVRNYSKWTPKFYQRLVSGYQGLQLDCC